MPSSACRSRLQAVSLWILDQPMGVNARAPAGEEALGVIPYPRWERGTTDPFLRLRSERAHSIV